MEPNSNITPCVSPNPDENGDPTVTAATAPHHPLTQDPTPASITYSSRSTSTNRQTGHSRDRSSNADGSDRVFPIRSVVTVDQSQYNPPTSPREAPDLDLSVSPGSAWERYRKPSISNIEDEPSTHTAAIAPTQASSTLESLNERIDESGRSRRRKSVPSSSTANVPPSTRYFGPAESLSLFNDAASDGSAATKESMSLPAGSSQVEDPNTGRRSSSEFNEALMTVRFRHVMTDDGHAVITGRDGTLQRCEDESIHTPGAVQSFGLLVALREEDDGLLSVRSVSENSKNIIGFSPHELFRLGSFTDILTEEQADNLLDHIDFIRDEETDPATNGPDVFSISVRPPKRRPIKLWCAMHMNPTNPDLIICEFELEDDQQYPLRPPDEPDQGVPEDTLYQTPTVEELYESTEIGSKPLRLLRSARKRRGEAGAMEVFNIMSQVQEQLASAPNLERFLKILVGIVKELTGFHRVMVYQFDATFNGKVVTELVDPLQTRDLYHGLQFPASDIPRQARELYKLNKVRLLYDRDLQSARLVCRSVEDLEQPLDLSHSYLRAMSPIHLKYLANMAVRSSMSISINAFNELWGLIACHSYGPKGMRVPFPIRKMCRLIGDTASRNIERLSYASRLQARKLINTMPTDKNPSGYIVASSDDLLKLFDADCGMLSIKGETKILGKVEHSQEPLALLEYLRMRSFTSLLATQDIREDFPDLHYAPGFSLIAGFLYVPLSIGGSDFIVFLRKGQIKDVKWAGNPYEKVIKEGTSNYLEPRSSFKVWHETVVGKCREWPEEQVETAAVLCLVYGKFIEVWRQKEAALQNSRLTRLLLANSAHEVRTPLNAIINCLEIAMEGSLDQETRENLARSHSASKSLIYVINDLLDLTRTEEGQELVKDEVMELSACIREATEPFKIDAKRKSITYEVLEQPGLPTYVHGDFRRVRQAVSNLTANAMQHTTTGSVRIEVYAADISDSQVKVEVVVQDTGCGMSANQTGDLFQDLEQVSTDVGESALSETETPHESRTLGLGLAVVARIVRNMDGQLRLKSEEGKGSRFVIQLPFELPTEDTLRKAGASNAHANSNMNTAAASIIKDVPSAELGEVMLVDRGTPTSVDVPEVTLTEKNSFDETNSIGSIRSGASRGSARSNKSDADRLIDAIQTPLSLGEPDGSPFHLQRRYSRERYHKSSDKPTPSQPRDSPGSPLKRPGSGPFSGPQESTRRFPAGQVSLGADQEQSQSGVHYITDSRTPIRPVKVPDEYIEQPVAPQAAESSGVLFEIRDESKKDGTQPAGEEPRHLRVLIAEDDPINMKIIKKRLEKTGHKVNHAVNGEDCASMYKEEHSHIDVILMDMQMPIVDGLSSTKIIRAFEKSDKSLQLSRLATKYGRVPIFAVSASLIERDRLQYIEAGFDGWILKPIDFKRLSVLLEGISKDDVRTECLYVPGEWERGGWFLRGPLESEEAEGLRETDGPTSEEAASAGDSGEMNAT